MTDENKSTEEEFMKDQPSGITFGELALLEKRLAYYISRTQAAEGNVLRLEASNDGLQRDVLSLQEQLNDWMNPKDVGKKPDPCALRDYQRDAVDSMADMPDDFFDFALTSREVYKSSTHGPIPLSFTGRRLLQNLRLAIRDGIDHGNWSHNGDAISRARGELAQYMSKLEGREPKRAPRLVDDPCANKKEMSYEPHLAEQELKQARRRIEELEWGMHAVEKMVEALGYLVKHQP